MTNFPHYLPRKPPSPNSVHVPADLILIYRSIESTYLLYSVGLRELMHKSKMAQNPASVYPDLRQELTPTSGGSTICSYSHLRDDDGPVAVLIHGYPQSAYMQESPCTLATRSDYP